MHPSLHVEMLCLFGVVQNVLMCNASLTTQLLLPHSPLPRHHFAILPVHIFSHPHKHHIAILPIHLSHLLKYHVATLPIHLSHLHKHHIAILPIHLSTKICSHLTHTVIIPSAQTSCSHLTHTLIDPNM